MLLKEVYPSSWTNNILLYKCTVVSLSLYASVIVSISLAVVSNAITDMEVPICF